MIALYPPLPIHPWWWGLDGQTDEQTDSQRLFLYIPIPQLGIMKNLRNCQGQVHYRPVDQTFLGSKVFSITMATLLISSQPWAFYFMFLHITYYGIIISYYITICHVNFFRSCSKIVLHLIRLFKDVNSLYFH